MQLSVAFANVEMITARISIQSKVLARLDLKVTHVEKDSMFNCMAPEVIWTDDEWRTNLAVEILSGQNTYDSLTTDKEKQAYTGRLLNDRLIDYECAWQAIANVTNRLLVLYAKGSRTPHLVRPLIPNLSLSPIYVEWDCENSLMQKFAKLSAKVKTSDSLNILVHLSC